MKTRTPEEIIGSLEVRAMLITGRDAVTEAEIRNQSDANRILELCDEMKASVNQLRYSASLAVRG